MILANYLFARFGGIFGGCKRSLANAPSISNAHLEVITVWFSVFVNAVKSSLIDFCKCISGISVPIGQSKIAPSIVRAITIYMVDFRIRPFARHPKPHQSINKIVSATPADLTPAISPQGSGSISDSGFARLNAPYHLASFWKISKYLSKMFGSYHNLHNIPPDGGWHNKRFA